MIASTRRLLRAPFGRVFTSPRPTTTLWSRLLSSPKAPLSSDCAPARFGIDEVRERVAAYSSAGNEDKSLARKQIAYFLRKTRRRIPHVDLLNILHSIYDKALPEEQFPKPRRATFRKNVEGTHELLISIEKHLRADDVEARPYEIMVRQTYFPMK